MAGGINERPNWSLPGVESQGIRPIKTFLGLGRYEATREMDGQTTDKIAILAINDNHAHKRAEIKLGELNG